MTRGCSNASAETNSGRRDVLVALIAAAAGVFGAGVGGFAAYVGNKELESAKSRAAARGAARVLQAQFISVDVRLSSMLRQNRVFAIDEAYRVGLPQDNQQLSATEVAADDWESIASAVASVELYATTDDEAQRRANAHLRVRLDRERREYVRSTREAVAGGIQALARLADRD